MSFLPVALDEECVKNVVLQWTAHLPKHLPVMALGSCCHHVAIRDDGVVIAMVAVLLAKAPHCLVSCKFPFG